MNVNFDYFNIFKEPLLFIALIARHAFKRNATAEFGTVLIVNTCLIGEFAASAPALHEYIRAHADKKIDLLVSPPLKTLAEHMAGIRAVYTAKSVFARELERARDREQLPSAYEEALVLRISPDAYRLLGAINIKRMRTGFPYFITYGIHIAWNLLRGATPRSWREVNFAMVGAAPRAAPFDEIFSVSPEEYARVRTLPALATAQKKIIIHTGASWSMNHWNADKWIELIKKLHVLGNFRFIFVGANKDEEDYRYISSRLPFPIHSLIGHVDLFDLALVLRKSDYFIGVDSGPRNLAHLAGLPSITLLGPGPHMFTSPNPHDIVLDRSGGRGLYQRFFSQKERFIERITPEDVFTAFNALPSIPN